LRTGHIVAFGGSCFPEHAPRVRPDTSRDPAEVLVEEWKPGRSYPWILRGARETNRGASVIPEPPCPATQLRFRPCLRMILSRAE
jgi:hypothetical protein